MEGVITQVLKVIGFLIASLIDGAILYVFLKLLHQVWEEFPELSFKESVGVGVILALIQLLIGSLQISVLVK